MGVMRGREDKERWETEEMGREAVQEREEHGLTCALLQVRQVMDISKRKRKEENIQL